MRLRGTDFWTWIWKALTGSWRRPDGSEKKLRRAKRRWEEKIREYQERIWRGEQEIKATEERLEQKQQKFAEAKDELEEQQEMLQCDWHQKAVQSIGADTKGQIEETGRNLAGAFVW